MAKELADKLRRLGKSIRKLEDSLSGLHRADTPFLMRIRRDELGRRSVRMASLPSDYPDSELSMAEHMAKILQSRKDKHDEASDECDRSGVMVHLLADEAGVRASEALKPASRRAGETRAKAARARLRRMGLRGISVSFSEEMLIITADADSLANLTKKLSKVKVEMKALGFSDVLVRLE